MKGVPAQTYFDPHFWQLRLAGYARLLEMNDKIKPFYNAWRNTFVLFVFVFNIQTLIYTIQIAGDLDIFVQSLVSLLSYMPAIAKLVLFRVKEDEIMKLLSKFDDPLFNQDYEVHKSMLQNSAAGAAFLLRIYFGGGIAATILWTMFPLVEFLSGKEASVGCYFGFDYNKFPHFYLVLFYSKILLFLVATGNTAMDCLISGVYWQCKVQIRLLRYNLERLHEICQEQLQRPEQAEDALHHQLNKCIKHLDIIYFIIKENERVFGRVVFLQLNMSGSIICVVGYRLLSITGFNFEFFCMSVFMILMTMEFFLYCFFGNEVKYESEQLIDSVYLMDWVGTPLSFQKSLIILMERCKRPMEPTAMYILPLSLDTFLKILKSAYTFYTVLTQTQ